MNIRAIIISTFGMCIAVGSVWASMSGEPLPSRQTVEKPKMVKLISARHDIRFGEEITVGMLAVQEWPGESAPDSTFTDLNDLIGQPGSDPRRAKETIRKGELVLAEKISEFGETVTIVQALGSNSRAVAIRVDSVTSVGGFVTPGDFVDIVLTEGKGAGLRAATILQDVRVLGVDQNTEQSNHANGKARTITVEVAPREGQILALAQKAGTLSLTLRTEQDVADADLSQITLADLLRNADPVILPTAVKELPLPKKRTITVRRGTTIEVVEVE